VRGLAAVGRLLAISPTRCAPPIAERVSPERTPGLIRSRSKAPPQISIRSGANGSCGALCIASAGYDYVTGIGTPAAASLINILAAQ